MLDNFETHLKAFVKKRTGNISDVTLPQNEYFNSKKNQCNEIINAITKSLPEDQQRLTELYEESLAELQDINDDVMYLQGLKDGVALAKILDLDKEVLLLDDNT